MPPTPHKIIPNLILALSAWTYKFESDNFILMGDKQHILEFAESLQELNNLMKQLNQLYEAQTEDFLKFVLKESVTISENDESKVHRFIERSCGEMVAWNLADSTEVIDAQGDVEEEDDLYLGIFNNSTELKELSSGIKERNQERKGVLERYS